MHHQHLLDFLRDCDPYMGYVRIVLLLSACYSVYCIAAYYICQVTSYSPGEHGHEAVWQWQILTGATWSNLPSPSGTMESGNVVPTLMPFSLRVHDNQKLILVAGDQEALVIAPDGSIMTTLELPAPPTHTLISADFSNDGLNDLILVTENGVYGFVQSRQPGALFFSTLVGCLIIVMGVIFVTQHLNSGNGKPRPPR